MDFFEINKNQGNLAIEYRRQKKERLLMKNRAEKMRAKMRKELEKDLFKNEIIIIENPEGIFHTHLRHPSLK